MELDAKVRTCFCFDGKGEEAATFCISLLPDSFIESRVSPEPDGPALVVEFTLAGIPYRSLTVGRCSRLMRRPSFPF